MPNHEVDEIKSEQEKVEQEIAGELFTRLLYFQQQSCWQRAGQDSNLQPSDSKSATLSN